MVKTFENDRLKEAFSTHLPLCATVFSMFDVHPEIGHGLSHFCVLLHIVQLFGMWKCGVPCMLKTAFASCDLCGCVRQVCTASETRYAIQLSIIGHH